MGTNEKPLDIFLRRGRTNENVARKQSFDGVDEVGVARGGTSLDKDGESIQGNCDLPFDLNTLYYSGCGREPSAFMAGASESESDDDEGGDPPVERVSYPCQAVVDSGASTHLMQYTPEHYSEFTARRCQIEIAKQGAHLNSVGEGTLPIRLQGKGNTRVNIDLDNTLFTPDITRNLFSVTAACAMGLSAIFTKDHVLFCREGDYSEILFTGRREGSLWLIDFDLKHNVPVEHALAAGCPDELVIRLHEQYAHATLRRLKEMANLMANLMTCQNLREGPWARRWRFLARLVRLANKGSRR